jgi:restriction endonuclease Mrr
MSSVEHAVSRRVFLSYAHEDRAFAERISDALESSAVPITNHVWEVSPGEDWESLLKETIRASDVFVVLLSPAARQSRWVGTEIELALSQDLDRRGVELIPVLVAPTDLPTSLRDRSVVDLTQDPSAGLRELVAQIQATSEADFSAMNPRAFEDLVADLLRATGFRVDDVRRSPDAGVDLRATYERLDPFGRLETEVWLIETKLYSHDRISVDSIRKLAGGLAVAQGPARGLLVTNAQLTSVAAEYLRSLERSPHVRLSVVDGLDLRRLLRQFPEVALHHFRDPGEPQPDSDANA